MNILVVDDEYYIVKNIIETTDWSALGIEQAFPAYSASQAKRIFEGSQDIDILLTDIEMPQMDGHHLTKLIKEDPVLKKLPVILFSSLITEEMKIKGRQLGADAQISKPEIASLVSIIDGFVLGQK